MQTIFPILRYDNARDAIRWLCEVFGFTEVFSVPDLGPYVRHAQLRLGTNIIMIGSTREEDGIVSPKRLGKSTQALFVYVEDPDAHHEVALSAGATVTIPPADTDFGEREYHVLDCEGHRWAFGTFRPVQE